MSASLIGRRGRVTGTVRPGHVGEVTLPLPAGGTHAYLAHPADGTSTYPEGTRVIVREFSQPLTVYVEQDVQDPRYPNL